MPREVLFFLIGVAATCLIYVSFYPIPQISDIESDKNLLRIDSIKKVFEAKNDSLKTVLDSISNLPQKTDSIFIDLNKDLQNEYAKTDTFTNADSLALLIKSAIHAGRIKND